MKRDTHYDLYKKNKSSGLKEFRHSLEYWFLLLFQKTSALFPLRWSQKFASLLGRLAFALAKKDRGIAEYQLEFCFPELTPKERTKIARNVFINVAQTFFETINIQKIRKNCNHWIKFSNPEVAKEALEKGNGAVFVFGHVGNWELLAIVYEMLEIQGAAFGSPIGAKKLNDVVWKCRESPNLEIIPRGDKSASKGILRCLRKNKALLFGMDQDMNVKSVFVDFFGRPASTPKGGATIAQKFNAPIVSAFGTRQEDGTHLYTFELIAEGPYEKTEEEETELVQKYTLAVEKHIRKNPDQWVWFHRRWKNQPGDKNANKDESV